MSINLLLSRLKKAKPCGADSWKACCPAHQDRTPSLSIKKIDDGRILLYCHAGCDVMSVLTAVGLSLGDLFPGGSLTIRGLQGWAQMFKDRKEDHRAFDKAFLAACHADRLNRKKILPKDLARERQIFERLLREDPEGLTGLEKSMTAVDPLMPLLNEACIGLPLTPQDLRMMLSRDDVDDLQSGAIGKSTLRFYAEVWAQGRPHANIA